MFGVWHVMSSHLSGTSFEVLLQHPQFDDITGVSDHCHYSDGVTAPNVAEETLCTVETEGTGHPKPRLNTRRGTTQHKLYENYVMTLLTMLIINTTKKLMEAVQKDHRCVAFIVVCSVTLVSLMQYHNKENQQAQIQNSCCNKPQFFFKLETCVNVHMCHSKIFMQQFFLNVITSGVQH